MKKIKNNKVIDLRNKSEHEKVIELGKISKKSIQFSKTLFKIKK